VTNKNPTAAQVLTEIKTMVELHRKNGKPNHTVGIDTLAITFGQSIPAILELLHQLESWGEITIHQSSSATVSNARHKNLRTGTVSLND